MFFWSYVYKIEVMITSHRNARSRVAILLTASKLQPCLLKQLLKTQTKLKKPEIMFKNAIYICIFFITKVANFQ